MKKRVAGLKRKSGNGHAVKYPISATQRGVSWKRPGIRQDGLVDLDRLPPHFRLCFDQTECDKTRPCKQSWEPTVFVQNQMAAIEFSMLVFICLTWCSPVLVSGLRLFVKKETWLETSCPLPSRRNPNLQENPTNCLLLGLTGRRWTIVKDTALVHHQDLKQPTWKGVSGVVRFFPLFFWFVNMQPAESKTPLMTYWRSPASYEQDRKPIRPGLCGVGCARTVRLILW